MAWWRLCVSRKVVGVNRRIIASAMWASLALMKWGMPKTLQEAFLMYELMTTGHAMGWYCCGFETYYA